MCTTTSWVQSSISRVHVCVWVSVFCYIADCIISSVVHAKHQFCIKHTYHFESSHACICIYFVTFFYGFFDNVPSPKETQLLKCLELYLKQIQLPCYLPHCHHTLYIRIYVYYKYVYVNTPGLITLMCMYKWLYGCVKPEWVRAYKQQSLHIHVSVCVFSAENS